MPTWLHLHPALANKVIQAVAGDDVIRSASHQLALLSSLTLYHGHKGIGPTAEVHRCVAVPQVVAQQLSCFVEMTALGEVPPVAAVPGGINSNTDQP